MPETKKILIVSNEQLLFEKLKTLLSGEGYDLRFALSNDPELSRMIAETKPSVVVVDPEIPGLNGVTLSLLIRRWCQAPILLISPALSGPNEIRLLDVSSKDWLSEPLNVDLVAVRVNNIV